MATTSDPRAFKQNLLRQFGELESMANDHLDQMAMRLRLYAAQGTPIDTGLLVASWQVGLEIAESDSPGAQSFIGALVGSTLNTPRYVFNRVVYAPFVEYGTATSRGAHMLARAVQRMLSGAG